MSILTGLLIAIVRGHVEADTLLDSYKREKVTLAQPH